MSVNTNFYINNTLVDPPANHRALEIELNFDKDRAINRGRLDLPNWDFVLENSGTIQKHLNDGTTTGVGIFEGIPLRVEIERAGVIEIPFNGYIDLTDNATFSDVRSNVIGKEKQKIDWLNDVADGFSFEYLYKETGEITNNDFIFIPYVLNSVPDYKDSAIALIGVYTLSEQLTFVIEKIAELAAEMSNVVEVSAVVKLVLYLSYLTVLIASILRFIKDLILLIIQPVKYHAGMRVIDLLTKGASHLGLTFKSDIFETDPYQDLVIIPEKYHNPVNPNDKRILGFTKEDKTKQDGFYKGTFGQLVRDMKTMFNAKIILTDNQELFLVRNDKTVSAPSFQLPDLYEPVFTTNADEFRANYVINYRTDVTDKNTIQDYEGTGYQIILKPARVVNQELVLMKGLTEVDIPFALAKRKEDLTTPEEIIKEFLVIASLLFNAISSIVNTVINIFNQIISSINQVINALNTVGVSINFQVPSIPSLPFVHLGNLIDNRIGMMKIETDFTTVSKIVLLDIANRPKNTKLKSNHKDLLHARTLYNDFHYVNSFYPTNDIPTGNQRMIKTFSKVQFTFNDYISVKTSNTILDANGNLCEVVTLKWNPWNQTATITLRIPYLLTNNFNITELIPDGK